MAVYKRGDKGVFYMNFTVNGVRVFRSTPPLNVSPSVSFLRLFIPLADRCKKMHTVKNVTGIE
jgi:hypothetical protein